MPAKQLLLATLLAVAERLNSVAGYTAIFRKQERLKGILGPEQTLAMKVRHQPFAVYLKFLAPKAGKEVVYAEGHHENKVIAHTPGRRRLAGPPAGRPPGLAARRWPRPGTRSPRRAWPTSRTSSSASAAWTSRIPRR